MPAERPSPARSTVLRRWVEAATPPPRRSRVRSGRTHAAFWRAFDALLGRLEPRRVEQDDLRVEARAGPGVDVETELGDALADPGRDG